MRIKVQCGKFLHEFEGAVVTYSTGSVISGKELTINSSKSGEYYMYEGKDFFTKKMADYRAEVDMMLVAQFSEWEAIIIDGEEEWTEVDKPE